MYNSYFNFSQSPFENNLDRKFLFLSRNHKEVLAALIYFVRERKGFALVCGDVGTGKTMLINYFLGKLPKTIHPVAISNPEVEYQEILLHIARALEIKNTGKPVLELLDEVKTALTDADRRGERYILIIDEAHLLPDRSLEHIRLLSNIETQEHKLLQILLVGQYELSPKLNRTEMRQLRQRININRFLGPLEVSETIEYIDYRLGVVGSSYDACFNPNCRDLIFKMTKGIPRWINHLCDNALLICSAEKQEKVSRKILAKANDALRSDLIFTPKQPSGIFAQSFWKYAKPSALSGLFLLMLVLLWSLGPGGYLGKGMEETVPKLSSNTIAAPPAPAAGETPRDPDESRMSIAALKKEIISPAQVEQTKPSEITYGPHSVSDKRPFRADYQPPLTATDAVKEEIKTSSEAKALPEPQPGGETKASEATSPQAGKTSSLTKEEVGSEKSSMNATSVTEAPKGNPQFKEDPSTARKSRQLMVKRGETLTSIASRLYPNNMEPAIEAILKANPAITNKDLILEGQLLSLPQVGVKEPAYSPQETSALAP